MLSRSETEFDIAVYLSTRLTAATTAESFSFAQCAKMRIPQIPSPPGGGGGRGRGKEKKGTGSFAFNISLLYAFKKSLFSRAWRAMS